MLSRAIVTLLATIALDKILAKNILIFRDKEVKIMAKENHILIVDDEADIRIELGEYMHELNWRVFVAGDCDEALNVLAKNQIELMILDIKLPRMSGLEFLDILAKDHPEILVIIISGHGDMQSVITSLRFGVLDYLTKPINTDDIDRALERFSQIAINRTSIRTQIIQSRAEAIQQDFGTYRFVGSHPHVQKLLEQISKVANLDVADVLITGESGVGKELVARAIHRFSGRRAKPYYAINCSAIPEQLFESELFGYKKNTFTGATGDHCGAFEAASGGILVLDEICSLPYSLQGKLLRVLEDKQVRRLGSHNFITVNTRIISISNRNLEDMVQQGSFREDLYHRLNTFQIFIPPLRERISDLKELAKYFLCSFASSLNLPCPTLEPTVIKAMASYPFPGNVRELKNMLRKAMVNCDNPLQPLGLELFSSLSSSETSENIPPLTEYSPREENAKPILLDIREKSWIESALKENHFRISKTAEALGVSRHVLYRKMQKYDIPGA